MTQSDKGHLNELADVRDGCPCTVEGIEPCRSSCSCANWAMSGGCDRCAKYGSLEQRQRAAKQIIAALRQSSDKVRESKACPLCGSTEPHSHTSGPMGMS